jgi:hypothetical protein
MTFLRPFCLSKIDFSNYVKHYIQVLCMSTSLQLFIVVYVNGK